MSSCRRARALHGAAASLCARHGPACCSRGPEGVTQGGCPTCRGGNEISLLQVGNNFALFFCFFCFWLYRRATEAARGASGAEEEVGERVSAPER